MIYDAVSARFKYLNICVHDEMPAALSRKEQRLLHQSITQTKYKNLGFGYMLTCGH